jgi:hypothetical protein
MHLTKVHGPAEPEKMGYVVAHFRKVKTLVGLTAVANHNSRGQIYGNQGELLGDPPEWLVNLDQASLNEGPEGIQGETILRRRNEIIREAELSRKPQKNAAAAIEAVFSASPGSLQNVANWRTFFQDCQEWLENRYGRSNMLQRNIHFDEKTPHMHVLIVPIIRGREGNKYASGSFLGGREGLRKAQDELHTQVGRKWGLERGLEGSNARHTDQAEWKRENTRKAREEAAKILDDARQKEAGFLENKEMFLAAQKTSLQGWTMPEVKGFESAKKYRDRITPEVMGKISRANLIIKNYNTKEKQLTADRQELDETIDRLKGRQGKQEQAKEYAKQVQRINTKKRKNNELEL